MYTDAHLVLDEALNVAGGTVETASSYPLGASGRDIAVGEPLYAVILEVTPGTGSGGGNQVQWNLVTDTTEDLATPTVVAGIAPISGDSMPNPLIIPLNIGMGGVWEDFLGLQSVESGTVTGVYKVLITHNIDQWKAYATTMTLLSK